MYVGVRVRVRVHHCSLIGGSDCIDTWAAESKKPSLLSMCIHFIVQSLICVFFLYLAEYPAETPWQNTLSKFAYETFLNSKTLNLTIY